MAKVRCPVITIALLVGVSTTLILTIAFALHYRRRFGESLIEIGRLNTHHSQAQDVSREFLNACRLLSIHRNGRVNVFTFARGDQIFTVETMGLLSDNPDEWRTMAGLTQ